MIDQSEVEAVIGGGLPQVSLGGKRVLALIPDTTRTAPVGTIVKTIHRLLSGRVSKLDLLVALGTHQPLSQDGMLRHLEMTEEDYRGNYGRMGLFNHRWDDASCLAEIGVLSPGLVARVTGGIVQEEVRITVNRMILDYDHILVVGPVFPHEIAGFSGGAKYLFPGISGPEAINFTHWMGALIGNMGLIGRADNPVRRVLDEAAKFMPLPVACVSLVVQDEVLAGVYVGSLEDSWRRAVAQSARMHIIRKPHLFKKVLACAPLMYDDLWTGGKCMYKCEPIVADCGELVIYAPHISSLSRTHGHTLEKIGYHVKDYYLKQMDRFAGIPRVIMAVSAYLRGAGEFENNVEEPRIRVTLASGISQEMCAKVGLGYADPRTIDFSEWQGREEEGVLFVEKAGETLFLPENKGEGGQV